MAQMIREEVIVISKKFGQFGATLVHSQNTRVSDIMNDKREFVVFTDCISSKNILSGTIIISKDDIIAVKVEDKNDKKQ